MNRNIITISGGISSAWVAMWATKNLTGETIFYFNDTKWEHPDLYRFIDDVGHALKIQITNDTDGRSPEQVFIDQKMLGSNRVPLCSKILKAQRLQKFARPGDILYFGIDCGELKRAARISAIYARLRIECQFPIIDGNVKRAQMIADLTAVGLQIPELYARGFSHNNCYGGCVRAGVKQWTRLFHEYPEVFADRQRVEDEFNAARGSNYSFIKGYQLKDLRKRIEAKETLPIDDDSWHGECVGICGVMN